MANGHGGARKGAGRKRKDEELKSKRLTINALIAEFGDEQKAFEYAAKQIKEDKKNSFNYFKLLIEYGYGKPTNFIKLDDTEQEFDFSDLTDDELLILSKMYARKSTNTED